MAKAIKTKLDEEGLAIVNSLYEHFNVPQGSTQKMLRDLLFAVNDFVIELKKQPDPSRVQEEKLDEQEAWALDHFCKVMRIDSETEWGKIRQAIWTYPHILLETEEDMLGIDWSCDLRVPEWRYDKNSKMRIPIITCLHQNAKKFFGSREITLAVCKGACKSGACDASLPVFEGQSKQGNEHPCGICGKDMRREKGYESSWWACKKCFKEWSTKKTQQVVKQKLIDTGKWHEPSKSWLGSAAHRAWKVRRNHRRYESKDEE